MNHAARGAIADQAPVARRAGVPARTKSTAARKNARVMVARQCEVCGDDFEVVPYEVKRGKARTCSMACAARLAARPDQTGPSNPNWKGGVPASEKNGRYIAKHPEKHAAHLALTAAIRRGELVRGPCEVCGDPMTDGHHDDYSKPLDVRWLCRTHHIEHHKEAGTQAPPVDTNSRAKATRAKPPARPKAGANGVASRPRPGRAVAPAAKKAVKALRDKGDIIPAEAVKRGRGRPKTVEDRKAYKAQKERERRAKKKPIEASK